MKKLTQKYLHNPKEISAGKKNISASKVEHELYVVSPKKHLRSYASYFGL